MKIYIVDDSVHIRSRLKKMLAHVPEVEEINEAQDISDVEGNLKQYNPDVMIIDIHLPKGNGFDVLKLAKNIEPKPYTIVLTNYSLLPYKKKCLELGANCFFDKSYEFNKVVDAIKDLPKDRASFSSN